MHRNSYHNHKMTEKKTSCQHSQTIPLHCRIYFNNFFLLKGVCACVLYVCVCVCVKLFKVWVLVLQRNSTSASHPSPLSISYSQFQLFINKLHQCQQKIDLFCSEYLFALCLALALLRKIKSCVAAALLLWHWGPRYIRATISGVLMNVLLMWEPNRLQLGLHSY